jgi:hypothetical protein
MKKIRLAKGIPRGINAWKYELIRGMQQIQKVSSSEEQVHPHTIERENRPVPLCSSIREFLELDYLIG